MVNIAILGCGAIAQKRHAPAISAFPGASFYAVYDPDETRARELAGQYSSVRAFTELAPLLADPDLDAVSICAPERFHRELAEKSFAAGKHVLLEKPMAMDAVEGRRILSAAEKSGKQFAMAFSQRCYPENLLAKKLIGEGAIGKVLSFRTILANNGAEYSVVKQELKHFYDRNLKNIGGLMLNVCCHRVDLTRFLFDTDFAEVFAFTPTLDKRFADGSLIDREDSAMITARMKNGISGTIWSSWCNYGAGRVDTEIFGSEGAVSVFPDRVELSRAGEETRRFEIKEEDRDPKGFKIVRAFLDTLINGAVPAATGTDGFLCMKTLQAIEESNKEGRWTSPDSVIY
jgi:predicted dehydrogenase